MLPNGHKCQKIFLKKNNWTFDQLFLVMGWSQWKSPTLHNMPGTNFANLSNQQKGISVSLLRSLPALWCQLLGHSVVARRGFPLCHWSPRRGRRDRHCRHPPEQIMDNQSRLLHGETEARYGEEWSVCVLTSLLWIAAVLWGDVSVMKCETAMRQGIMLVCSVEWCLLTVITKHNGELSWLSGPL